MNLFDCPHPAGKARLSGPACIARQEATRVQRHGDMYGNAYRKTVPVDPWCAGSCPKGREVRKAQGLAPLAPLAPLSVKGIREIRKPCPECGGNRKHTPECSRPKSCPTGRNADGGALLKHSNESCIVPLTVGHHACDLTTLSDEDIRACIAEAERRGLILPTRQEFKSEAA